MAALVGGATPTPAPTAGGDEGEESHGGQATAAPSPKPSPAPSSAAIGDIEQIEESAKWLGASVAYAAEVDADLEELEAEKARLEAQIAQLEEQIRQIESSSSYQSLTQLSQAAAQKQQLESQLAQAQAAVDAQSAILASSQVDVSDTQIVAPFSGKIDTNPLAEGSFVTANSTVLTTISGSDPMRVRFSVSQADYLDIMKGNTNNGTKLQNVTMKLSDGTTYPENGSVTQVDRGVSDSTGTLTLKAEFQNPNGVLLPGMFANLTVVGSLVPNAILVPQRAVTDVMYKHFVYVINDDNTVSMKEVQLGARVGKHVAGEERSGRHGNRSGGRRTELKEGAK